MTTSPTIYLVEADLNHYAGLRDTRQDYQDIYRDLRFGMSLRDRWTPPEKVSLIPGRQGDFASGPDLFANISLTRQVYDFMHERWSAYVECLPFHYERIEYWGIYLPKVYPCLDEDATEYWGSGRQSIRTAIFREQYIPDDLLFRAPGRWEYYCGEAFKQLMEQQAFTGLVFRKLWSDGKPLSELVTSSSAPVTKSNRLRSGRPTKRDRILRRLWTDVIDTSMGGKRLAVLTDAYLAAGAPYALLSDAAHVLTAARARGLTDDELSRLLRSVAYHVVFETLSVLDEESLASSAALRDLHADLLVSGEL